MRGDANVAAAAALLAEPARAALVLSVIDEGPLPASELAARAGIAPSTASEHLARLVGGGFLTSDRRGRYRYYQLADAAVAAAVEALAIVAPQAQVRSLRAATSSELVRYARTCYDHLAGQLGVALARALEHEGTLVRRDGEYALGAKAATRLARLGIDLADVCRRRRPLVRGCLDWSERELHLAGALGAAITARLFELDWIRRRDGNRSVELTEKGRAGLVDELGVAIACAGDAAASLGTRPRYLLGDTSDDLIGKGSQTRDGQRGVRTRRTRRTARSAQQADRSGVGRGGARSS